VGEVVVDKQVVVGEVVVGERVVGNMVDVGMWPSGRLRWSRGW
jgi:hypothetical protein